MASLARRAARRALRALGAGDRGRPAAKAEVVRERVVVRELVLPEGEPRGPQQITELDRTSLLGRHALPPLERMGMADRHELVEPLLSVRRMAALGVDPRDLEFPEASWKRVYNRVHAATSSPWEGPTVEFDGATASELNAFLGESAGAAVRILAPRITLDETIRVPSRTAILGGGARVVAGDRFVEKAVLLDDVCDARVRDLDFGDGCCGYAVFVKNGERFAVEDLRVSGCRYKAICVMGANRLFSIRRNRITNTGNGAIFLNGDVAHGVVEGNAVDRAGGHGNFSGGIVLASLKIEDMDTAFNPWQSWDMAELTECPHDLAILGNVVRDGEANGLYSHAAYRVHVVGNTFEGCNKEGMCLDFGSCGCYVARNVVRRNGGRFGMDDHQLESDFIQDFGMLPDGSSPAKVPGISMDNAAYNTLYQNVVAENYGSGIKAVRAGVRNVILCNEVADNNVGESEVCHFFGIELASDLKPDYESEEVRELDFAPCYENIVARNTVSGRHYSGIFLGPEAFINDAFDNVIMETPRSVECVSQKFNSILNNY